MTLDPHKWLYQPYECGCLLVRQGHALREAFEITPDYLRDSEAHNAEVNFADLGLQLTRTSRALKCWMSLRYFGVDAFRGAIDQALDLAELAASRIEESDCLELVAPPSLGIVCFRRRFPSRRRFSEDTRKWTPATPGCLPHSSRAGWRSRRPPASTAATRSGCACSTTPPRPVTWLDTLEFLERAEVDPGPAPEPEAFERERDVSRLMGLRRARGRPRGGASAPLRRPLAPGGPARARAGG